MQGHIVLKPISEVMTTTISTTPVGLPSVPDNALYALINVESANVRVRFCSTGTTSLVAGTASGGMLWSTGVDYELHGWDALRSVGFISDTGDNAYMNVVYMGEQ